MCAQTYVDDCYDSTHTATTDLQAFEDNFAALKSAFSGATEPANTVAGMWWFDTTANILKLRNEANNAWQSVWDFANNKPVITNLSAEITDAMIATANKDGAAGTACMRTLGTTATSACAGNDPRLGVPADLSITTAKLAADAVTNAKLADNAVKTENIYDGHVTEAKMAASAISQTKLKTSYGEVSGEGTKTLPGGQYGFYPQLYNATWKETTCYGGYATVITLQAIIGTPSALQRYVTSSGEVNWLYILRDKKTKAVKQTWFAPDHPCMGQDCDPDDLPHPFIGVDEATEEVICINPSDEEVDAFKKKKKKREPLWKAILDNYEIDDDSDGEWTDKDVTIGLPDDMDWKMHQKDSTIKPVKMKIPQPNNVLCKKLKRRGK